MTEQANNVPRRPYITLTRELAVARSLSDKDEQMRRCWAEVVSWFDTIDGLKVACAAVGATQQSFLDYMTFTAKVEAVERALNGIPDRKPVPKRSRW